MKTKNTLLLLLFFILVAAAAWFYTSKSDSKSTLPEDETAFAVSDTASVDKIFIASKFGQKNLLERRPDNTWALNKNHTARHDQINLLLKTLHQMEVKRPVDKSSRNAAIRNIATSGKKVEIYQNGKLSKVLHVGGTTDNDLGTYFLLEGSETPYVLHIPGFVGFLNTRFDVNDENWRSVKVFRTTPETLKSLKIDYTGSPQESFTIKKSGDTFEVSGVKETDQEQVRAYLQNYKFVNGEFFYPNPQKKTSDSLAMVQPKAVITIEDKVPGNSTTIKLYDQPQNLRSLAALDEKNREVMSVQNFVFDRVLVRKDAFRKNASQTTK